MTLGAVERDLQLVRRAEHVMRCLDRGLGQDPRLARSFGNGYG